MKKAVVLLGYMGSGKSVVAQELAHLTGYKHLDLDQIIEQKENLTIPEIFNQKGEIYFRKIERLYLENTLQTTQQIILSLGGGTPCYGNNLDVIKKNPDTVTVYLSATVQTLTARLFKERIKRPLINHLKSPEALNDFIRKHLFERSFFYNQANVTIKTDEKNVSEIVEEIRQILF